MANRSIEVVVYTPASFDEQPELSQRFDDVLEEMKLVIPKLFRRFPVVEVTVGEG